MKASFWWHPLRRTGVTNREVWAKLAVKWDLVTPPAPRLLLHDTLPDSATAASVSLGDDHLLLGCFVTATTVWHCIVGRDKFYIFPSSVTALLCQFILIYFFHSTLYSFPFLGLHVSLQSQKKKKQFGLWNYFAGCWYVSWCVRVCACVFVCVFVHYLNFWTRWLIFTNVCVCAYMPLEQNPIRTV